MEESHVPNVIVAGPIPVSRSINRERGSNGMKTFIYKSKKDLIEGIRTFKKSYRKKLTLIATDYRIRKLIGFEDTEGEHYWAVPEYLENDIELSTVRKRAFMALRLSTKTRTTKTSKKARKNETVK